MMRRTVRHVIKELQAACRSAGDFRSFSRLALDVFLYRLLRVGPFRMRNRERTVRLRNGVTLTYRLNRGDIQGIREVWYDNVYRLPFQTSIETVVDLGANIGLTSVYLAKRYGARCIVAVEPDAANAGLLRRNLRQNAIEGTVVEAAIGPADGTVRFASDADSNLGHVSLEGREVPMISMETLCARHAIQRIDVLKIDIEGGEQQLLSGPIGWLSHVKSIIAEFHPDIIDYAGCVERIESAGLRWIRPHSVYRYTTDCFLASDIPTLPADPQLK